MKEAPTAHNSLREIPFESALIRMARGEILRAGAMLHARIEGEQFQDNAIANNLREAGWVDSDWTSRRFFENVDHFTFEGEVRPYDAPSVPTHQSPDLARFLFEVADQLPVGTKYRMTVETLGA